MSRNRTQWLLFGAAAGIAIAAVSIGLLLMGLAVVIVLQAGAGPTLPGHPLFVAGWDLVRSSLIAALPLMAIWFVWRQQ